MTTGDLFRCERNHGIARHGLAVVVVVVVVVAVNWMKVFLYVVDEEKTPTTTVVVYAVFSEWRENLLRPQYLLLLVEDD